MNYADLLKKTSASLVCVGLDPVVSRIPFDGSAQEVIEQFGLTLLDVFQSSGTLPGAVKPNSAYYEAHGVAGMYALQTIMQAWKKAGVPVILDAKRADIGRSSTAYASAAFDAFNADAVTVAPYMGSDSVFPFLEYKDKGVYILNRTSNPGAKDFQDLLIENNPLYLEVAKTIASWNKPNAGVVAGATYPDQLGQLASVLGSVPYLIPGVGAQGGSVKEVLSALVDAKVDLDFVRINSSSGITYAYEKSDLSFADAAVQSFAKLNDEINQNR